jgi:hypothetical protein
MDSSSLKPNWWRPGCSSTLVLSSSIVVIDGQSGAVLYAGSAPEEG